MRLQTLWEAKWILLGLMAAALAAGSFSPWLATVPVALIVFTLYFFRDPRRPVPHGMGIIVSPADGTVSDIAEIDETEVTNSRMWRVGIFLSVFDVHVNRAPARCRVTYTSHKDGDYHDARSPMAATHNTARTWGFDCDGTMIVVRQITGAIARRIVPWAMLGDRLERGERFGMIRFGSRTEICLPLDAKVAVRVGDHVAGGSTVIGRLVEKSPAAGKLPGKRKTAK